VLVINHMSSSSTRVGRHTTSTQFASLLQTHLLVQKTLSYSTWLYASCQKLASSYVHSSKGIEDIKIFIPAEFVQIGELASKAAKFLHLALLHLCRPSTGKTAKFLAALPVHLTGIFLHVRQGCKVSSLGIYPLTLKDILQLP
jgi:hypothetical protein